MNARLLSFLATSLLAASAFAGSAEFHPSTYTTYKKLAPNHGSVSVLEAIPPAGKFIEIGLVRVASNNVANFSDAEERLKSEAAAHGGNAIVLEDDARFYADGKLTPRGTRPQHITATAIVTQ